LYPFVRPRDVTFCFVASSQVLVLKTIGTFQTRSVPREKVERGLGLYASLPISCLVDLLPILMTVLDDVVVRVISVNLYGIE